VCAAPQFDPISAVVPQGPTRPGQAPETVALIINTFNQPEYLARVLRAVSRQEVFPNEVLVADDGSGPETRAAFAQWALDHRSSRAEHVWQEHNGFRRSRILNETIARTRSEYLVFLDGDTVPHPRFIADHLLLRRPNTFLQGHRALLKEAGARWFGSGEFVRDRRRALWTGQLQGLKHAFRWPRPSVRTRGDLRGVRGCNLAIWRQDLLRINGYNEAFVGWGREDSELAVRLMNSGVQRRDARGWALCYHLWHPPASRSGLAANDDLLAQAQASGATRCELGLQQHLAAQT
jgi:glycosyltransferase involved in cell wall biosynthesis